MALTPPSSKAVSGSLAAVASTGNGGHALVNGTGTILSYTTPDDGALHPVVVTSAFRVDAGTVGGVVRVNIGDTTAVVELAGGLSNPGPAVWRANDPADGSGASFSLPANTLVTVTQDGAVTAGAVTAYIEILSA